MMINRAVSAAGRARRTRKVIGMSDLTHAHPSAGVPSSTKNFGILRHASHNGFVSVHGRFSGSRDFCAQMKWT